MKDCILFFVKYPVPGEVKTRLAEDSSPELAAELYATVVEEKFAELKEGCEADLIVCHAPEGARQAMRDWLGSGHRYLGQKGADLGRRMENAFREAFLLGYDRVILVGSDVPGLTPAILDEGLNALNKTTACLGPTDDGGYYGIGFHRQCFTPEAFHGVEWSTAAVFDQTASRLEKAGVEYQILQPLEDMDTSEDVETLVALGTSGPLGPKSLTDARRLIGI
jgi:hypothetical protein